MALLCCILPSDLVSQKQNVKLGSIVQILMAIAYLYKQAGCKLEEKVIQVSVNNDCIRSCDTVTYECTVFGDQGGFTVWTGDFFVHCSPNNKAVMILQHEVVETELNFIDQMCNNGSIVGRIARVENGAYISQLNVTLTSDIVGRSIECAYDNGTTHRIGSINLTTVLVPGSLQGSISSATILSQFYTTRTFNWNTSFSGCPNVQYNILASNCGSCPTTTNHTNVTCTDIPTDGSTCVLALQTVVCGIITGELSSQVSLFNRDVPGSSENRSAVISAVYLGVALFICLIGLILTVIVLLIKSKTKVGTVVVNSTGTVDKIQSRSTQSSGINTKKNISYVVHSPKLNQN